MSWWDFGESYGSSGSKLALYAIECPFCGEKGNFELEHHAEKKKPNGSKLLNFDTYKCGACAGYILVFWSASEWTHGDSGLHNYKVIPWAIGTGKAPEYWPPTVQRLWVQAHKNINDDNPDAAAVMARGAMQAALRDHGARGKNTFEEIENLGIEGKLPPLMTDWAHEVRLLGNNSVHPEAQDEGVKQEDAKDIVNYLDYLLEYLYDLPKKIENYRKRKREAEDES